MLNAAILTVVIATGVLLASPRLAKSTLWRATITPLASIIGSGFLVLGPILEVSFGLFAPLVMLALTAVAYAFGAAIRYNIRRMDMGRARSLVVERIEKAASVVLAFAYVISVAYYLNLFGSFGVSLTSLDSANDARVLTTAVFAVILFVGWTKGFAALERMEQVSVGLKLTIIAGLLFGLAVHFAETVRSDGILLNPAQVSESDSKLFERIHCLASSRVTRRMCAIVTHAAALAMVFSQSFDRRRHRPSQASVRSTTHRRGKTSKPSAVSERLTIWTVQRPIDFRASRSLGPA